MDVRRVNSYRHIIYYSNIKVTWLHRVYENTMKLRGGLFSCPYCSNNAITIDGNPCFSHSGREVHRRVALWPEQADIRNITGKIIKTAALLSQADWVRSYAFVPLNLNFALAPRAVTYALDL